jgi:hypothetical protein
MGRKLDSTRSRGCTGLLLLWMTVPGLAAQAAEKVDLDTVIIPRKTDLYLELKKGINSRTARQGDKFSALVEVPVTVNDSIVIPVGSYVLGHVVRSKGSGYVKGKAELLLGFDTVILPDGTTRQIRAVVDSAENYTTQDEREEGTLQASGSQAQEVGIGAVSGAATGAITGATIGVFRGETLKGAGIGAAVGAAGGAVISLLKKGEEVELPKGSSLTIQLQDAIRFVKPPAPRP